MKRIIALCCFFLCFSCSEYNGHKEEIVKELQGTWNIVSTNGTEGNITFTYDGQFTMDTQRGKVSIADYEESPSEETLCITWAENENGDELLTDEDYNNGGIYCKYIWIGNNILQINNLPYFRNETVKLNNKQ